VAMQQNDGLALAVDQVVDADAVDFADAAFHAWSLPAGPENALRATRRRFAELRAGRCRQASTIGGSVPSRQRDRAPGSARSPATPGTSAPHPIHSDAILPSSSSNTKSTVTGLPGKSPEISVVTTALPERSAAAIGVTLGWYLASVSRRHAAISLSPRLTRPSSVTVASLAKQATTASGSLVFSDAMKRAIGLGKCAAIATPLPARRLSRIAGSPPVACH